MDRWREWLIIILFGLLIACGLLNRHNVDTIVDLRAKIEAADAEAKHIKQQGEENAKRLKQDYDNSTDALNRYYQRLLRPVPSQASSNAAAASPKVDDGTGSEQGISGCSPEFRLACLKDANKVEFWRQYGIVNHIPTIP